jgi:hypothetical protein
MLLIVVALTTMTTVKHSPIAVESGTAIAQEADEGQIEEEPTEAEGATSFPLIETKEERDYDLYLDAAEVERRAAEEQSGGGAIDSASRVPVSFRHLALPLPPGGIDHAVAGVATRNSGNGVIRLRGVPQNSTLILALLVWGEITAQPGGYPVGFAPVCNSGTTYQGFLYGTTQQPCWNPSGVYAGYIANVTPAILPSINGDYQVKGLNSAIGNNCCPWGDAAFPPPSTAVPLSEGASLIVFYTNPLIPLNAQIYLHLGPQMFSGGHTVTHFTGPILPGMLIKHSRIGADGQVARSSGAIGFPISPNCGLRSFPPISNEQTWIINSSGQPLQIKGDGAGLNRDSDWNGDDGEPLNKLWDTHTDMFSNSNFLAVNGGFFYSVRYVSQGDCIVWAAHILGIR